MMIAAELHLPCPTGMGLWLAAQRFHAHRRRNCAFRALPMTLTSSGRRLPRISEFPAGAEWQPRDLALTE
jgi:hypothetical protein